MFNSGWAKMEKYYNLTEESPAYIARAPIESNRIELLVNSIRPFRIESFKSSIRANYSKFERIFDSIEFLRKESRELDLYT